MCKIHDNNNIKIKGMEVYYYKVLIIYTKKIQYLKVL